MFIILLILAFLAVILIRAILFKPKPAEEEHHEPITVDREKAVSNLQKLVQCRTVSYVDHEKEDDAEFEKLIALLPKLYPHVFETCTYTNMENRALLFCWKGKSHEEASVLMAHFDVVPTEDEHWDVDPFAGIIKDDILWGRGTLDTKVTFNGILTAADRLISEGFIPQEDIYLAFSGGEEVSSDGAEKIVNHFREHNIRLSMVLDEGGAVVEDVFPGVKEPCALVGIAEKGIMDVSYTVASAGGHASAPKPHTPVGVLAKAVSSIEDHPLPMHISPPVRQMFDTLGRHSSFAYRILFANLWCFKWVLNLITKKSGGELNALMRTTVAFTQMSGSKACNVIPPTASVTSNIRINPGETIESVKHDLISRIHNPDVTVTVLQNQSNPSPISRTDVEGWKRVAKAINGTWPNAIVSPYLMVQCSDSRHYGSISDRVYRFSAMDLTSEERATIHGNNERIRLEVVTRAVEFFTRVMKQC